MRKTCAAVIVAAGSASRMGGIDKMLAPLAGVPVVLRSARELAASERIDSLIIVTRRELTEEVRRLCCEIPKLAAVVPGGASRAESTLAGLAVVPAGTELAAIHDGARPLVTWQVIDRVIRAANTYGAAAPAIPVKDTIKVVQGGVVKQTPDRATLFAVQTPQVFDFDLLRGALKKAQTEKVQVTDDCSAVERMGMAVKIVEGDERNIKVTTPLDLKIAELLLEELS